MKKSVCFRPLLLGGEDDSAIPNLQLEALEVKPELSTGVWANVTVSQQRVLVRRLVQFKCDIRAASQLGNIYRVAKC